MRLMFVLALLVSAVTASVETAFADVVELDNGDRISGTVNGLSGSKLLIKTEYAGVIAVDVAAVANVQSATELGVQTAQGQRVVGRFAGQLFAGNGGEAVPLADVASATDDLQRFQTGRGPWESRADLSGQVSSGNSDTQSYTLRAEAVKRNRDARHRLVAGFDRKEDDGDTTKDELDLAYEYNWFFSERWYAAANANYFKDELKDLNYRVTLGGGLGYLFWEDAQGRLAIESGVSAVLEDLDNKNEANPALRWALHYKRLLLANVEFHHDHQILALADTDRGQIFDSSTGLRMRLNASLDATLTVDWRHETEPAAGREKSDTTLLFGVGYRF